MSSQNWVIAMKIRQVHRSKLKELVDPKTKNDGIQKSVIRIRPVGSNMKSQFLTLPQQQQ
ncbi:unnamed protein product, partial [Nesidiocoris tenuis]